MPKDREAQTSYDILAKYVRDHPPDYGDGNANSILEMLFCQYEEFNQFDTEEIKRDFRRLYEQMNGLSIKQMDPVIDTTCTLCREHQKSGFIEGIKVGVRLGMEFM